MNFKKYKKTLIMPKTDFSMRANLTEKEPLILQQWGRVDLYNKQLAIRKKACNFILHDGPPYANGRIHIGTALNKILKDILNRFYFLRGNYVNYIPGWDCHGLPIEWIVEKELMKKGKAKKDISIPEFRSLCRAFANKWISIQKEEFIRLGINGNWDNFYSTMKFSSEASILAEMYKFLEKGYLYREDQVVMWSPYEKTSLAEAEIEYKEITSKTAYFCFKIMNSQNNNFLAGVLLVVWTTTPWTIPANQAIAMNKSISYGLYKVLDGYLCSKKVIISNLLKEDICKNCSIKLEFIRNIEALELALTFCEHPFFSLGFPKKIPLLEADFVTDKCGTGFVHIAPGHGQDDFFLGRKNNIDTSSFIDEAGYYKKDIPYFSGLFYEKGNQLVIDELIKRKLLLNIYFYKHKYPHSWRSKKAVIFRSTKQWFLMLHRNGLLDICRKELDKIKFFPSSSFNRFKAMVLNRNDWLISRQRVWGVPMAIFINKKTGTPLLDEELNCRIIEIFRQKGSDIWFKESNSFFLGGKYVAGEYEKVYDILDVWFDSGCTHEFVLERYKHRKIYPAQVYLEGSDQHRGWFQSSLLEACGTGKSSPYENLITHGFVLDMQGMKMSKSLGNVISPQDLINKFGADILRLWVSTVDYQEDIKVGEVLIKEKTQSYRKIRNVLRFLLGVVNDSLYSFEEFEYDDLPFLEKWILFRIYVVQEELFLRMSRFNISGYISEVLRFVSKDLSSFYFDVRKDILYCEGVKNKRRRMVLYCMSLIFDNLVKWLAPIIPFTAEEAWQKRYGVECSIHLERFSSFPEVWASSFIKGLFDVIFDIRNSFYLKFDILQKEGEYKSLEEIFLVIFLKDYRLRSLLQEVALAELLGVSGLKLGENLFEEDENTWKTKNGILIKITKYKGKRCPRCWFYFSPEKGSEVCLRCSNVLASLGSSAA